MKIWLLVVIVSISVDPGETGLVSPEHGTMWRVFTDREHVRTFLRDGACLINVVYYDPEMCRANADAILTTGGFDHSNSVNATCVEFDIAPPQ